MARACGVELPEPKPDHVGVAAHPFGPRVYLIVRHDGKMVGVEPTRHGAAWAMHNLHDCDDYRVEHVPVGSIPLMDIVRGSY